MRHPGDLWNWAKSDLHGRKRVIANLHLRVVTPMFGGSAQTRVSDDVHPVQGSSVRGHLRFWWRACNARDDLLERTSDLFEREAELWGSAASKQHPGSGNAAIEVEVTTLKKGSLNFHSHDSRDLRFDRRGWHHGLAGDPSGNIPRGPSLALFPFQATSNQGREQDAAVGREGVEFQLRVTLAPHVRDEKKIDDAILAAEQALWAWITFGGVGSRTRRGCGTLWCVGDVPDVEVDRQAVVFQPNAEDVQGWFKESVADLVKTGSSLKLVPALHLAMVQTGSIQGDPIDAWRLAVDPMHDYRQKPGIGRNPGQGNRPGQSRWPEPAAIRGLRGWTPAPTGHSYEITPDAGGSEFPRADFGLPILFQQMDGIHGTPTLQGARKGTTRLASPIILKALPISPTQFVPMALMLDAPHVWDAGTPGVELAGGRQPDRLQVSALNAPAPQWPFPRTPPPGTTGKVSVRDAFMEYLLTDRNWTKMI